MPKNRKNTPANTRFALVLNAFFLCAFVAAAGVGYVWQKDQIYSLCRDLKQREQHLHSLRQQNESLNRVLALLQSTPELDQQVKRMNLGLVAPQPDQIIRLPDSLTPTPSNTTPRALYATKNPDQTAP